MVTQQIDSLKREYTDKYVVVDATQPELARFRNIVGRVKTVNMSGRALVEFDEYLDNIGWYDIDVSFLKVVDKPPPKAAAPAEKKPAAKPAAAKPAGEAASAAVKKPAPAKPQAATGGKLSTADILAAARGGKAVAPAKPQAAEAPAAKDDVKEQAAEEESVVQQVPAPAAPAKSTEKVDKSKMTIDDILAWCRAHDSK